MVALKPKYLLAMAVLVLGFALLAPSPGPAGAAGVSVNVSMLDYRFEPKNLTVFAGTKVVWKNDGISPHTATSDSALWDSRTKTSGQTYSRSFDTPGVYPYNCIFHQALGMTGSVTVVATATQTYLPFLARGASGW